MKSYHSEGIICIKDRYGIEYRVCHLAYTLNEDETFEYVFTPNYSVIDPPMLPFSKASRALTSI